MCGFLGRWFFRFYPSNPKKAETKEGEWMRFVSKISTVVHTILVALCLALIGFSPLIFNFLQAMWSYSVYLTLREREMALYIFLLLVQIGHCFAVIFTSEKKQGTFQLAGFIANIVACCILTYLNARAWYEFRTTGGLHGKGVH